MSKHPDKYYQRFTKPFCQCEAEDHGHTDICKSRRYLVVHHRDHARQDQDPKNLITLCSSCHRKEHRAQSHYYGRAEHRNWAEAARTLIQRHKLAEQLEDEPDVKTD